MSSIIPAKQNLTRFYGSEACSCRTSPAGPLLSLQKRDWHAAPCLLLTPSRAKHEPQHPPPTAETQPAPGQHAAVLASTSTCQLRPGCCCRGGRHSKPKCVQSGPKIWQEWAGSSDLHVQRDRSQSPAAFPKQYGRAEHFLPAEGPEHDSNILSALNQRTYDKVTTG